MLKYLIRIIGLFFFIQCSNKDNYKVEDIPIISLNKVDISNNNLPVVINKFIYIPLETTGNNNIGQIEEIFKTTNQIIIKDHEDIIFIFSLEGKFINQINRKGKGPEEYVRIDDISIDPDYQFLEITDGAQKKIIIYDLSGNFVTSANYENKAMNSIFMDDATIVNYVPPGSNPINSSVSALNVIPLNGGPVNYISTNFQQGISPDSPLVPGAILTRSNQNEVIYKEPFNDTVYTVTRDNLAPRLVFDAGENEIKPEDFATPEKFIATYEKRIQVYDLLATQDFVCFLLSENNIRKVVLYHYPTGENMVSTGLNGIINENDGIDFLPRGTGIENELVSFYYPHELKRVKLNAEGKLNEIAANLKDDDNPVVVVANMNNDLE